MDEQLRKKNEKANEKDVRREMEMKEEEKGWPQMAAPITLEDCLAVLTKNDLSEIRTSLGVSRASSLKKQELITVLEQQIPIMLPHLLNKIDDTRYSIIKQIAGRGGHAFLPLEPIQLDYFKNRGLIFSGMLNGKKTLAIPQEVLQCFKNMDTVAYRETIRRNTEWLKLSRGLLFYYGYLSLDELHSRVSSHVGTTVVMGDFLRVLEEAAWFYLDFEDETHGFSNRRVWDAEQVEKEHQSRPDLPFYPFTKAQLIAAGESGFVDRTRIYQAFVSFIMSNYPVDRSVADKLVEECVYAIQIGEAPSNLLQFLQSQLEIDKLELIKGFMDHIVKLNNTTRQWIIKGYSPDELSSSRNKPAILQSNSFKGDVIDMVTRNKVGRNDPCPCGSGKKFKKCCAS